jgi:hypothetical protein
MRSTRSLTGVLSMAAATSLSACEALAQATGNGETSPAAPSNTRLFLWGVGVIVAVAVIRIVLRLMDR